MSTSPDVSILVAAPGADGDALPATIRSIREQTLWNLEVVVVQADVAAGDSALMISDPRLRLVHHSSADTGALFNRGLSEARGTWVMFCQPGERLERHAAKNLLRAVETAGTDLGCGVMEVANGTGEFNRWRSSDHQRGRLESIDERPDLVADSWAGNKIFRRAWLAELGLRFDEGVRFADEGFTLAALAAAQGIAVIAETACFRNRNPAIEWPSQVELAGARVQACRRVDAWLAEHGTAAVQSARTRAVLAEELPGHLGALLDLDDPRAQAVVQAWQAYLLSVDLAQAAALPAPVRIALYHVLVGDLDGVRHAMRCHAWSAVIEVPVRSVGDRQAWACEHLESGPSYHGLDPAWWLDISALGIVGVPDSQARPCHRVQRLQMRAGGLSVVGTTEDAFGLFTRASSSRLAIVTSTGRSWCAVPLRAATGQSTGRSTGTSTCATVTWRADAPWRWQVEPLVDRRTRGSLALELTVDGRSNRIPVRMPAAAIPRGDVSLGHGIHIRLRPGPGGSVSWSVVRPGRGWHAWRQRSDAWGGLLRLLHRRALILTSWLASHLPPRAIVVFESSAGRAFDGHPRAISEALAQDRPRVRQAWAYIDEPERFPGWADSVRQDTLRHRWMMSRARWWVTDDLPRQVIRKQPRNRFLQTWRGQPIACIGSAELDAPIVRRLERRPPAWQVRRWDLLLSPSKHFSDQVVPALGFTGDLIGSASPFGASVLAESADPDLRRRLDLPLDRPVILWATAEAEAGGPLAPEDLRSLLAAIGTRAFVLLARDAGPPLRLDPTCQFAARDVTAVDGRAAHLAASDLLITDGSIWTLDFARLNRPMVLWEPGYQRLRRIHGTFIDLPMSVPGPSVGSPAALIAALEHWLSHGSLGPPDADARGRNLAELAGPADGQAATRCGEALITGRTNRRDRP